MKYIPLVLAGLWRKPTRTIFTALSIIVAFILLGILSGIDAGFAHVLESVRLDRMYVTPRFGIPMPVAYIERIAAVPGVTVVAPIAGLGGYFRDPKNTVFATMTDARYFTAEPSLAVSNEQLGALLHTRTGAIVAVAVAKKYDWKVGDKVSLITGTPQRDGSRVWTFDILAIAEDTNNPGSAIFVSNYKYLDEARTVYKGTANYFIIRIKDPARAAETGRAIDGLFHNSPASTRSVPEKSMAQVGLTQLGDVSALTRGIASAVLFTLLFLTGNTMMQSVRERTSEFGVLKSLGFTDSGVMMLVLGESFLLCALAGVIGLALANLAPPLLKAAVPSIARLLLLSWSVLATGFCCALLVAFLGALFPALRVNRLNVVDALAGR